MEEKNRLTPDQSIINIGLALAKPDFKASQAEHLALLESWEVLKEVIEELKNLKESKKIEKLVEENQLK